MGIAAVAVVVVIVLVLIGIKLKSATGTSSLASQDNQPAPATVVNAITNVPATTLDQVGKGSGDTKAVKLPGPPLQSNGKPEVLYMGANFCPYCAIQRWGMIVALSRFGKFTGLELMTSAADDVYPNTPTFTFVHTTFTSSYVVFTPVEMLTNQKGADGNYTTLQTPTAQQNQIMGQFDTPPYLPAGSTAGSIPFIDIANAYLLTGTPVPQVLQGETWQQIADAIQQPSNATAQAIDGVANLFTATICASDGDQPGNVCTSPAVRSIQLP